MMFAWAVRTALQAYYFDRDDTALRGLAKLFKESSGEKRQQAEKLMDFQNKRGGRIVLQDIKVWRHACIDDVNLMC